MLKAEFKTATCLDTSGPAILFDLSINLTMLTIFNWLRS
jgi:hypothetical protein